GRVRRWRADQPAARLGPLPDHVLAPPRARARPADQPGPPPAGRPARRCAAHSAPGELGDLGTETPHALVRVALPDAGRGARQPGGAGRFSRRGPSTRPAEGARHAAPELRPGLGAGARASPAPA